jgi:tRNA-intron endonuclease
MNSELSGDLVIVRDGNIAKIHEKSHYGNMTEDGLQLSLIEALYLMEKGKLDVKINSEDISIEELFQIIQKDPSRAPELISELHRWNLWAQYRDRVLKMFKKS